MIRTSLCKEHSNNLDADQWIDKVTEDDEQLCEASGTYNEYPGAKSWEWHCDNEAELVICCQSWGEAMSQTDLALERSRDYLEY